MPFPFVEICNFLQRHEDIELRQPPILRRADKEALAKAVTESWFKSHRAGITQLDTESSVALLSTLLPERRTDRVYNIKTRRLVHILSRCLGLSASRAQDLHAYTQPGRGDLGQCLERVLANSGPPARPPVMLQEVDDMLQVLAGACQFSDPAIQKLLPGSSEARDVLIGNLIKRLQPQQAKWLVRLILKDFSPVRLNECEILRGYHFLLPGVLRFQDRFSAAVSLLKGSLNEYPSHPDSRSERLHFQSATQHLRPTVGVKVGRPNFHKARGIDHSIRMLGGTQWVLERKYDGEYCEIHIDLTTSAQPSECITIFSKNGKNSTEDRKSLRPTVMDALRLGQNECRIKRQAIILGEMVVYSDKERRILPFDEIRKHVLRSGRAIGTDEDSFPKAGEHLAIVFFDLLLLDNEAVMNRPVDERRTWLREVYRKIGGHAIGAEWKVVDFASATPARRILMQQFAASIAQRCEGLVLKPCGLPYVSLETNPKHYSHSYIKLKKDYIVGMGDEADFAVVGASYNAQQVATCGVSGIKWTEFFLGCLMNRADVQRFDARPHFKVVGPIQQEHCIPKPILQSANAIGRFCATPHQVGAGQQPFDLDVTCGMKIDVIFDTPFVFEVLGSGFEKPSNCNFYMLRHARVTKLHEDRTWRDAVSMQELQEQASAARSAAADSESQEMRRWLEKLERKSRRKLERERTGTPKTRTSGTPSTTVMSTGRTRVASAAMAATATPAGLLALDGTTLIDATSLAGVKRRRHVTSQTPCPVAKRPRTEKVPYQPSRSQPPKGTPLADITNHAATVTADVPAEPFNSSFPKRLSGLFKPTCTPPSPPLLASQTIHACLGPGCALHNSTIYLSTCIRSTPYIAHDLLTTHLTSDCTIITSGLSYWEREAFNRPSLAATVSESPAYKGRRKVVLVESRRRDATREVVRAVAGLNSGVGLGETVEVWDWRVLEWNGEIDDREQAKAKDRWFLGALEWDPGKKSVGLVGEMPWSKGVLRRQRI